MNDRTPGPDDATLQRELDTWFEGEVRQAAADLRRAPLRPARARVLPGRGVAAPAVAAALVVILALAGISRLPAFSAPAAEPTGHGTPTASLPEPSSTPPGPTHSPAPTGLIAGRYQDGIPAVIDGEFVLRQARVGGSRLPNDGSSFLIGGWLLHTEASRLCPLARSPLEICGLPVLASTPLENPDAPSVHLGLTFQDPVNAVVFRVHADDPRAADCQAALNTECQAVLVVEDVIWTDDEMTRTAPVSTIHAFNRLQAILPELTVLERTINPDLFDPPTSCDPGFPVQTWSTPGLPIAQVLVFPSVADREAVDDNFNASGFRGTYPRDNGPCVVTTDSLYSREWVIGQNVMVAVQVDVGGATPAQSKLADDVRASLTECSSLISCSFVPVPIPTPST